MYKNDNLDIEDLVKNWLNGDNEAFGMLYDYYVDNLYRFVYFKVKDERDVEDLVEITFLKVFEKKDSFNPKKSSFVTWLYNIARNTVIDFYRTQKETEVLNEDLGYNDDQNFKDNVNKDLNSDILKKALSKVSDNYRDLVVFRFIEDLSYLEIANILGKKEGAIRVMQYRALNELKDVLNSMGFDYENLV